MKRFDAIVIGAGQAGPPLAGRLTAAGMTVAFVERKLFGGTCVNTGCTPTKTLVASAQVAQYARRAAEYGVEIEGAVRVNMAKVKTRADAVSAASRTGLERWLRGMKGCTVIQGLARFEAPDRVRVGDEQLTAARVFVNVGGRPLVPDLPGVDQVPFLTNRTMLELDRVPEHLVVVGGSYVGLEFAQMHRRFGAKVTIVERQPRLIGREDPDISEAVREILAGEGIAIRTGAECIRLARHEGGISVGVDCQDGEPAVVGSHVLLAVGRRPNTDDLGLDKAGVATDARGYITVDEELRTSVPGVWALGDANGRGAFTHTSYNDFQIVSGNLLDGERRRVSDRPSTYALFIDPPLGRVGMSEAEVRARGKPALVGVMPMTRVGRARERGETQGFMKVLVDADSKQILGASFLGTSGDEAIHCVLDTMYAKAPYPVLKRAMHIHPTVSELIPTLLGDLKPA
jgi:pyruvate/2-oxoglutarate dehydrogenase complex dihydrolipoamide dehydrogenase (E3) component